VGETTMMTELCKIMNSEGSDKGGRWHNYTLEYYKLFKDKQNEPLNIFELGLGTSNTDIPSNMGPDGIPGASLRAWKTFFPIAYIFGADIDDRIIFTEDRIETFYVDQTDPKSVLEMWNNDKLNGVKFDIIIDDGLHTLDANRIFFENSINELKEDGIFIIEDINYGHVSLYEEWLSPLDVNYEIKELEHPQNKMDNCLIFITKDLS